MGFFRDKVQTPLHLVNHGQNSTAAGYRSCLYYSNWSVYARKHFPSDIPADIITNIFYAFIGIDPSTGSIKFTDEWADIQLPMKSVSPNTPNGKVEGCLSQLFQLKMYNRHLKVSMSIGGWGAEGNFQAVVSDEIKFNKFVDSCMSYLQEYGFDGIDLDWEYPKNPADAKSYVKMVRTLRERLNQFEVQKSMPPGSLLLTIAAPAGKEQSSILNLKDMDQYLSFWNLMLYDFSGSWSSETAYQSNLFGGDLSCDDSITYYLDQGIPPWKLVLGMPVYGRGFTNTEKGTGHQFNGVGVGSSNEAGIWSYKSLPPDGATEEFDYNKVSACCYQPAQKLFIAYDNQQSAKIKAKYVESRKLGGGMWWESCGDTYDNPARSVVYNFVNQLGNDSLDKSNNQLSCYNQDGFLKRVLSS